MADKQMELVPHQEAPAPAGHQGMSLIERAAFTPNFDLEKLETLMRLDAQAKAQAAKRAYSAAMSAAQAEMPRVLKGKENSHTRSMYADLAAVDAAIKPIVTKHGFSLSYYPVMSEREGFVRVGVIVAHAEGHEERHEADFPLDAAGSQGKANKTGIQAFGSTVTYARRYLKLMVFDIATGDDNDGNNHAPLSGDSFTEQQAAHVRKLLKDLGRGEDTFLQYAQTKGFQADKIEDLPFEAYDDLVKALNGWLAKQQKGGNNG